MIQSQNVANWQATLPAVGASPAQTKTFLGYVAEFNPEVDASKLIVAEVTIRLTASSGAFTGV